MRHITPLLLVLSCTPQLPPAGSPESARACESLRLTIEQVRRDYGYSDEASRLARTAFLLQAREYDEELGCPDINITDEEIYR